jgi:5-methylcytosine-specific restriction protein A
MSRREFPKQVKRDALKRAAKCCEACGFPFGVKFHFDHDIADGLGGEPTLDNCKVLCHACHADKTTKHDVPLIAKVKRINDKHNGIRTTTSRPMPGSRASGLRKRMNGTVDRRS